MQKKKSKLEKMIVGRRLAYWSVQVPAFAKASALDPLIPKSCPVLVDLCCISSPIFSPSFYAIHFLIKAILPQHLLKKEKKMLCNEDFRNNLSLDFQFSFIQVLLLLVLLTFSIILTHSLSKFFHSVLFNKLILFTSDPTSSCLQIS